MKKFIIPISIGLVLLSSCSRNTVRNTQADDFIDRCSVVKTGEKIFQWMTIHPLTLTIFNTFTMIRFLCCHC